MSSKKEKLESEYCGKKRSSSPEKLSNKRIKCSNLPPGDDETVASLKRRNLVEACKQVSYNKYYNYAERFDLLSLPPCATSACIHQDLKNCKLNQIPGSADELFKIEIKSNMWYEALDVGFLSINRSQYLSPNILKCIIEIILNAHEDSTCNYTISNLLRRCQQILSLHFSMHPPCTKIKNIRNCYIEFLTSPMDLKENTFTNRSKFECSKGLVNYSLNRLEAELNPDSNEEALFNRLENTPEELKNNVQGLHWQKEKFEIFEMLNRTQRIERLMVVLESIIELVQLDLTIWHSRFANNLSRHITNQNRPIMMIILWSKYALCFGGVTNITRQILQLFVNFIHLQYPERHIQTMKDLNLDPGCLGQTITTNLTLSKEAVLSLWLNCVIETYYLCENNSNSDYPNIGKTTSNLASAFYKIITVLPQSSIIRILERIQPSFMRYLISKQHLQSVLPSTKGEIIAILVSFIKNRQWEKYCGSEEAIPVHKEIKACKLLSYLTELCVSAIEESKLKKEPKVLFPKLCTNSTENDIITQNCVIYVLFLALQAFLDTYSLQSVQETWDRLNDQLDQKILPNSGFQETNTYSISENFVKKYKSMFQMLQELLIVLHQLKNDGVFPEILNTFKTIYLLGL